MTNTAHIGCVCTENSVLVNRTVLWMVFAGSSTFFAMGACGQELKPVFGLSTFHINDQLHSPFNFRGSGVLIGFKYGFISKRSKFLIQTDYSGFTSYNNDRNASFRGWAGWVSFSWTREILRNRHSVIDLGLVVDSPIWYRDFSMTSNGNNNRTLGEWAILLAPCLTYTYKGLSPWLITSSLQYALGGFLVARDFNTFQGANFLKQGSWLGYDQLRFGEWIASVGKPWKENKVWWFSYGIRVLGYGEERRTALIQHMFTVGLSWSLKRRK